MKIQTVLSKNWEVRCPPIITFIKTENLYGGNIGATKPQLCNHAAITQHKEEWMRKRNCGQKVFADVFWGVPTAFKCQTLGRETQKSENKMLHVW